MNKELVERLRHGNYYTVMKAAKEAADILEAQEGWVSVPRGPTDDDMYEAFMEGWQMPVLRRGGIPAREYWNNAYRAMLAAVEKPK